MIDTIGAVAQVGPVAGYALTDDQKTQVAGILSNSDPKALSESAAQAIVSAFAEAGFSPGRGLKEAIDSAGFDAREIRDRAEGRPPEAPLLTEDSGVNPDALAALKTILDRFDLSAPTPDVEEAIHRALAEAGLLKAGSVMDVSV